jgi:hypothetical protein
MVQFIKQEKKYLTQSAIADMQVSNVFIQSIIRAAASHVTEEGITNPWAAPPYSTDTFMATVMFLATTKAAIEASSIALLQTKIPINPKNVRGQTRTLRAGSRLGIM